MFESPWYLFSPTYTNVHINLLLFLNNYCWACSHSRYPFSPHILCIISLFYLCRIYFDKPHEINQTKSDDEKIEMSFSHFKRNEYHTFASVVTTGLGGNCTSVAFSMVFSWRISCCDWLWPNGLKNTMRNLTHSFFSFYSYRLKIHLTAKSMLENSS